MTTPRMADEIWESVLPICNDHGAMIGTGVVVAPSMVLTALHVVEPEPAPRVDDILPVTAIVTLQPWQLGRARRDAKRSHQRIYALTGEQASTVDLALLAVPGLHAPALQPRTAPVRDADMVTIPGYSDNQRTVAYGPITASDGADFVAHVLLTPGNSGAPVIDVRGRLAGLITMAHPSAGAIAIGPQLLVAFLNRASRRLRTSDIRPWRALTGHKTSSTTS